MTTTKGKTSLAKRGAKRRQAEASGPGDKGGLLEGGLLEDSLGAGSIKERLRSLSMEDKCVLYGIINRLL